MLMPHLPAVGDIEPFDCHIGNAVDIKSVALDAENGDIADGAGGNKRHLVHAVAYPWKT